MHVATPPEQTTAIICTDSVSVPHAEHLAAALGLPFLGIVDPRTLAAGRWLLTVGEAGLAMQQSGPRVAGPVAVDFVGGKMGFRRQRQESTPALVKALGVRPGLQPRVWDLTAGLGQDAFILAKYGCDVTLFERNPLIHCLLDDGLERARRFARERDEGSLQSILDRLSLVAADSIDVLSTVTEEEGPEIIYIDTMFPERSKSAKVKKGMQLFQQVVGGDPDAEQLLTLALRREPHRIVVKRPVHAPGLNQLKPSVSHKGKSIRFDIYALKKLGKP